MKKNTLHNLLCTFFVLFVILQTSMILLLRGCVLDTQLCNKVCQWFAADRWFSPGTPVSSTNNTDRHDIAEILLKVALNSTKFDIYVLLLSLGRYLCWWTISPRGYHPPSSQCFGTDMV